MNLLLFQPGETDADGLVRLDGRRAEHIFCVLHAKPGDRLRAGLLNGGTGTAEVLESTRHSALVRADALSRPALPGRDFIPLIALPRPQSFKKTLHFIASSGIRTAVFTGSERVEKSYWKSAGMKPEAVQRELILGLEQGGCTILPDIRFEPSLPGFLSSPRFRSLAENAMLLAAHPRNAVPCPVMRREKIVCAIGPEGGYVEKELDLFERSGFRMVEIGPYILRVEFALAVLCGRLLPT